MNHRKTRIHCVLLAALLCLSLLPTPALAADTADTSWYTADPEIRSYAISTAQELAGLAHLVLGGNTFENVTITLTCDISLDDFANWTPIGNEVTHFGGTFDGGGFTISGLSIDCDGSNQGLFGYLGSTGTVQNVTVRGTVSSTGNFVGGVVGWNEGTILGCVNHCAVSGTSDAGGIAGDNLGTIQNCANTGEISIPPEGGNVGGIAGYDQGVICDCFNCGAIDSETQAGGIAGYHNNGAVTSRCLNTGTVSGADAVGGVVGLFGSGSMTDCYYLDTAADTGIGKKTNSQSFGDAAAAVTAAQLLSGEVFTLLQSVQGDSSSIWDQDPVTPFTDIAASRFSSAIAWVSAVGLMNGVSDTSFAPEGTLTRAMVVTTLYRLAGEPLVSGENSFSDVQEGLWYAEAVLWATENGIVTGYPDETFLPDQAVSRQELAVILCRYASGTGLDTASAASLDGFDDSGLVQSYAALAVAWAVENSLLVSRSPDTLDPSAAATRAEVAQALCQLLVIGEAG